MNIIKNYEIPILTFPVAVLLTGCSMINSNSNSDAASQECRHLIGQGNIAMLNGEYAKSNQYYLQAYNTESCQNSSDMYVINSMRGSYSSVALNYEALGQYKEALTFFNKDPNSSVYQGFDKLIVTAYADPAKKQSAMQQLTEKYDNNTSSKSGKLYDLRYASGERSLPLLKSYLNYLDFKTKDTSQYKISLGYLDFYENLIHASDYDNPIKLAQDLNQKKVENALSSQQSKVAAIESKAAAQNIPGPGTSSGNPNLLASRAYFYANEYKNAGFNELAEIYASSLEKSQASATESARQKAIDLQDAADQADKDRAESQANTELLTGLLTSAATAYVTTKSNQGSASSSGTQAMAASTATYAASAAATPGTPQPQSRTQPATQIATASRQDYPDAGHCLQRDDTSNSLADFWINSCNFAVNVTWYDGKDCSTGCSAGVGANDRQSITKGVSGSTYNWVACPKPSTPRGPDGVTPWVNNGRHSCNF